MYKPPTTGGVMATAGAFAATDGAGAWWVALGVIGMTVTVMLLRGGLRRGRGRSEPRRRDG